MLEFLKVDAFYLMYFGHLCNFMMSLYVSSEICLWRLWDLSCFQILSMNLGSTQTTVGAANRFGVGFSPDRTHVSGNAPGNVSRVVTWLMIGCLVELRLDLFYIEIIMIVTLCNLDFFWNLLFVSVDFVRNSLVYLFVLPHVQNLVDVR